jgi:transcriptional regulator with XRE-family HTH domain
MNQWNFSLQLVRPREFSASVGIWIRATRQRNGYTQSMLASRAGVPASSLSRLERQGEGSISLLAKLLFALGTIDSFHAFVREQIRLAMLPSDISRLPKDLKMPKRIRPKQGGFA